MKAVLRLIPAIFALCSLGCICGEPGFQETVDIKNLLWTYKTQSRIPQGSTPAVAGDGTIYFGTDYGYVYALKPEGSLEWKYKAERGISGSIALSNDGDIYFASVNGCFYSLSSGGTLKWMFQSRGRIPSSPAIDKNERIWFVEEEETDTVWEFYSDGKGQGEYYLKSEYHLVVLEPDGSLFARFGKWDNALSSPVIASDGSIYFTSLVYLYALNPDGSERWKFPSKGWALASPSIAGDGTVYFG